MKVYLSVISLSLISSFASASTICAELNSTQLRRLQVLMVPDQKIIPAQSSSSSASSPDSILSFSWRVADVGPRGEKFYAYVINGNFGSSGNEGQVEDLGSSDVVILNGDGSTTSVASVVCH